MGGRFVPAAHSRYAALFRDLRPSAPVKDRAGFSFHQLELAIVCEMFVTGAKCDLHLLVQAGDLRDDPGLGDAFWPADQHDLEGSEHRYLLSAPWTMPDVS